MRKVLSTSLLIAGVLLVTSIGAATAQNSCPEGRTAGGTCVDGPLAALMRQNAIIFSQPQLSHTAYPVLPSGDWNYRYPNQLIPNPLSPSPTGEYLPPPPPP